MTADENLEEPKEAKTPRKGALPGLMRKFNQMVKKIEVAAQREQSNVAADDERIRAMINTAGVDAGVSVERMLRNSKLMSEADNREFARSKGWRV